MRAYRASKRPPKPKTTIIINNQPQPQPQQYNNRRRLSKQNKKQKAPQQLIRAPQQVVKELVPMYKPPNAQPISDDSIATYLSQFKKVYEHFTTKKFQ